MRTVIIIGSVMAAILVVVGAIVVIDGDSKMAAPEENTTALAPASPETGDATEGVAAPVTDAPPPATEPAPAGETDTAALEELEPSAGEPEGSEPAGGGMPYPLPPAAGPSGEPRETSSPDVSSNANSAVPRIVPRAFARDGYSGSKVLSYFQQSRTRIDARRAFGFVLLPRAAVTEAEKKTQVQFCETLLATLDFMAPGVASVRRDVMATYWPILSVRGSGEITEAFASRDCDTLLAWYDHTLARQLARRAGVQELSGPLLITWPSSGLEGEEARDPLIVDFSRADHDRATKTLQYWFRQLKNRPELWTNRIREGTIRAELADAVNETAGVMLAVMAGKWDSVATVTATP